MKHLLIRLLGIFAVGLGFFARGSTLYVDLNSGNPTPPYSDWSTAATNIQDAIDASTDGDLIWVTNGVYQTGGKTMAGNLTNRVVLDKAVTVQSVNGPLVTTIAGIGATNNTIAVRCAWLTNSATLAGFTLMRGATRGSGSGDLTNLQSGGAVWCASPNSMVSGCVIVSNTAYSLGGAAYQGSLENCFISSDSVLSNPSGGAAAFATLNSCTVVSNNSVVGLLTCQATNCISYYNQSGNYSGGSTFAYSCTTPAAAGTGNFTSAPQFFADHIHLAAGSPGIGAGTTPVTSTDLFGTAWANPATVGCAESGGLPYVMQPQMLLTTVPVGFAIKAPSLGAGPLTNLWLKDGTPLQDDGHFAFTQTTNLVATGVSFADAGNYQLVVGNAFGMTTSAVARVVIHCVNAASATPAPPYTSWETAATNIQDAITAAATNEVVLVTNGVYATGGKSMDNIMTNRVSIDKPMLVQSVNGAGATVIQGAWDPISTNGLAAVRCVWMTNNSVLSGFTICGGATRTNGFSFSASMGGGGIYGGVTNLSAIKCFVWNCVIATNCASYWGGGAYSVSLYNCTLVGNHLIAQVVGGSVGGAGAVRCNLRNCVVTGNVAEQGAGGGANLCSATNSAFIGNRAASSGGGVSGGTIVNCTIAKNFATDGAASSATLINSIAYGNYRTSGASNYSSCTFSYSDSDPLPAGTGNIDVDPQLLADNIHLAQSSPCIGAGTLTGLIGTDLDGQPWGNPPAIGCDEWQPAPAIVLAPTIQAGNLPQRLLSFSGTAGGQSLTYFWLKDGTLLQDNGHYANSETANLTLNNFGPDDSGLYQFVASNSFGIATSQVAKVGIHAVDAAGMNPVAPYATWQTAATNIQDAIDSAGPGEFVLATNGIYSTGGKAVSGDLTNRVALDKALTVMSVNGYASTIIEGQWDSSSTNGPGAVRCAWIGDGAVLNGFTLRNGATRGGGFVTYELQCGGGAWLSTNAVISDCVLTNNNAQWRGGGVLFGTVNNCFLTYNMAQNGGGAFQSSLNNCTIRENHCTSSASGAGVDSCVSRNCIIVNNYVPVFGVLDFQLLNYPTSSLDKFTNCCTSPLPFHGTNNITADPMFLDYYGGFALAPASPCYGAGNPLFATGTDLDDEPFLNPPSIGCDEFIMADLTGPLSVSLLGSRQFIVGHRVFLYSAIEGRPSQLDWTYGDGTGTTNIGSTSSHTWTNAGTYSVTLTAYNLDHPAGVSSTIALTIDSLLTPTLQVQGVVSNAFQFTFDSQPYAIYNVQYTTNLTTPSWQTLPISYYPTGGTLTVQDPAATNGSRFYRVQAQ